MEEIIHCILTPFHIFHLFIPAPYHSRHSHCEETDKV